MKKHLQLWTVALLLVAVASCKKDDAIPGPKVNSPDRSDTLAIGGTLRLSPELSSQAGMTYNWTVNGVAAGTDAVYNFTAATRGEYRIVFKAGNQTGIDSVVYGIRVWGKYENGFLMLQEGMYGNTNGDFSYYSYDTKTITQNIFVKENAGKNLGPVSSTLQYSTIHNGKIYMVSKIGGPLVAADAYTMKETGRVNNLPGDEGHAFLGVDNTRGLLSTVEGIYQVNLAGLTLGAKVAGIDSTAGDMMLVGNYIFTLTYADGIVILKSSDYSIVKKYPKATIGFVRTKDGSVYAAGDSSLMKIDPVSLAVTETKLPFKVTNPWAWMSWRSGSITASVNGNEVYLAERMETIGIGNFIEYGGTKVYRYVPGTPASVATPFITLPAGQYFYGSALRFNERTKELLLITNADEWATTGENKWLMYDAATGTLKNTIEYNGYYFPALPIFY